MERLLEAAREAGAVYTMRRAEWPGEVPQSWRLAVITQAGPRLRSGTPWYLTAGLAGSNRRERPVHG